MNVFLSMIIGACSTILVGSFGMVVGMPLPLLVGCSVACTVLFISTAHLAALNTSKYQD